MRGRARVSRWFGSVSLLVVGLAVVTASTAAANGVLFMTGNSNNVDSLPIAADGSVSSVGVTPLPGGANTPRTIAITPDAKSLYLTTAAAKKVVGYSISGTTLTGLSGSPYSVDTNEGAIATSPNGSFVYVATQGASLAVFSRAADGSLTKVGGVDSPLGYAGMSIAVAPDGAHAYITDGTANKVHSYSVSTAGAFSEVGTARSAGANPRGIAITPDGRTLVVSSTTGPINSFPVLADGTLGAAATSTTVAPKVPETLGISEDGQFAYMSDFSAAHTVLGFSIAADSTLTAIPGQPFAASNAVYGLDVAPNGFVYTATDNNPSVIDALAIGSNGALTAITGSPFTAQAFLPEFQSVVALPNQGPTAGISATPAAAGSPTSLDASASADPDGSGIAVYAWDFGDGQTATTTTPTTTHTYAAAGTFSASVTVTDGEGCSNALIFTGQTADCNGTAAAKAQTDVVVPNGGNGVGPKLKLTGPKTEKLDAEVEASARCDVACTVTGTGKLVVTTRGGRAAAGKSELKRRVFNLKPATISLNGKKKGTLSLKLPRKARRAALRALRHRGHVRANLTITATDANANATTQSRRVTLVRKKR